MSKEKDAPQKEMPTDANLPITIHAQYVKDLSFENPNTPDTLRNMSRPPEMDVNIGMDARKLEDDSIENLYEVVLNARAIANNADGGDTVFIAELQYGVTVSLNGVPEDQHHPILLIEIPRLAFPYARQILSQITVQGGYPPLLLNPVDFQALYVERFKDELEADKTVAKDAPKEKADAGKA